MGSQMRIWEPINYQLSQKYWHVELVTNLLCKYLSSRSQTPVWEHSARNSISIAIKMLKISLKQYLIHTQSPYYEAT